MAKGSKGFKRLSWLLGVVGALVWLVVGIAMDTGGEVYAAVVLLGTPVAFLVSWMFTRAVGWVVQGFREDREPPG